MNEEHKGGFLAGVVIGAIIGAAIALLYAPETGEKTRKLITKKAKELKEKGLEASKKANKVIKEAKGKVTKAVKEFKEV